MQIFQRDRRTRSPAYLGYSHGILETVFLGSPHVSKLQTVAAQFPQIPDVRWWDEGCHDKIHPEQAGDMDGIPEIRFPPFGLFDVFRMCQDGLETALLQDIENRNPIFAGRFHADISYTMGFEPLRHIADILVCRLELSDVKDCFQGFGIRPADGGHEDFLVDINARADRAFDITVSRCDDAGAVIKCKAFEFFGRIGSLRPDVFLLCIAFF